MSMPSCGRSAAPPSAPRIAAPAATRASPRRRDDPADIGDAGGVVALASAFRVDLVVVGPEAPLVAGLCDALRAAGIRASARAPPPPGWRAARPSPRRSWPRPRRPHRPRRVVTSVDAGMAAVAELGLPVAIKADGLAAGKGGGRGDEAAEAREALEACLVTASFGDAGGSSWWRRAWPGPRCRCSRSRDGRAVARFPAARDYKPSARATPARTPGGWARSRRCPTSRTRWPTSCSTGSTGR